MGGRKRREAQMRVAMVVGILMFNLVAGLYESGGALDASTDAGLADAGLVQAYEGELPPPPSWP
jgi:hypothetical protein